LELSEIDFDRANKDRLINLLVSIKNRAIEHVEDNYAVSVRLKDNSIFAYAPRRFAHAERLEVQMIIDDLLSREIIQPSTSPYCACVVPVRKKNNEMRLCVDLRPLNYRIIKQKYPFPAMEDGLSRLGKSVFTFLDLKDSFYQIGVSEDSTKYFAFATPDGQYEYKRLPFGYSEAPAEFQKRLRQILEPWIRADKIIVYMDDVLIPSNSVEQNLKIISWYPELSKC